MGYAFLATKTVFSNNRFRPNLCKNKPQMRSNLLLWVGYYLWYSKKHFWNCSICKRMLIKWINRSPIYSPLIHFQGHKYSLLFCVIFFACQNKRSTEQLGTLLQFVISIKLGTPPRTHHAPSRMKFRAFLDTF